MPKKRTTKRTPNKKIDPVPKEPIFEISAEAKRELLAIVLVVISLLIGLAFFNVAGPAGRFLDKTLSVLLGVLKFVTPIILIAFAGWLAFPEKFPIQKRLIIGVILFMIGIGALVNILKFTGENGSLYIEEIGKAGGYLGLALAYPLLSLVGFWGAIIILIALIGAAIIIVSNLSLSEIWFRTKQVISPIISKNNSDYSDYDEPEESDDDYDNDSESDDDEDNEDIIINGSYNTNGDEHSANIIKKPKRRYRKIDMPLELLEHSTTKPSSGDINGRLVTIKKTLDNFGIKVEMGEVSVGPTVTQFTLKPAAGIKLSRITALSNDLALSLAAHPIRIEAPIPGKSLVGIEVPNHSVATVTLREVLESKEFDERKSNLTICLGKDVAGNAWIADLKKMPHMLVAGSTGSGKTVCLNSIILSLIFQNGPDDLKLLLIDPKRVELPIYNGIPHLLTPAITEVPKIINSFKWAIGEMERRFELLSKATCRDIGSYNERHPEDKLPYIIIVVDELADLMVAAASEVESSIIRLAQMARAVGIHLIIATQRPSVDVITGLIKANVTTRIAFAVASSMDSRTILDTPGADTLVGRGDMLCMTADLSKPKRIQCCYVGDGDIKRVAVHLKTQIDEPVEYENEITERQSNSSFSGSSSADADDELYEDAKITVIKAGKASASYLQRRLKIGYARAARLLDLLEENGIIGPGEGAKPRQILVNAIEDEDGYHIHESDDSNEDSSAEEYEEIDPNEIMEPDDDNDELYDDENDKPSHY